MKPEGSMKFHEFLNAKLGTTKWVVAGRLTERMRNKGYTIAITPKRHLQLEAEFEAKTRTAQAQGIIPGPQWWGPLDGTLHLFEGFEFKSSSPIRVGLVAACGWAPPVDVMEMPEEFTPDRLCPECRKKAE